MSYRLTADRVNTLFRECLATAATGENISQIHGVTRRFAIDLLKIKDAKPEIAQMLSQMDDTFMIGVGKGGGWSFLNACVDRRGRQWCDLHETVEKLVILGMAAGFAFFTHDRDLWDVLPGGLPYFSIRELEIVRNVGNYFSQLPVDG